jgi:putative nucleotidyltransferase with HDIG domain
VLGADGNLVDADSDQLGVDLELLRGPSEQLALALSHLRSLAELERASIGALTALARAVDAKSSWTRGHAERVAEIAVAIAEEIGWTEPRLGVVRRGALLHDVGKIGVPVAVLDKPDRLTTDEVALLRTHVEKGARILEPIEAFADLLPILWQHHERLDGSGYPRGLEGSQIDPAACIVAVADVFEALTAERPYRGAQDPDATLAYLVARAGGEFDLKPVAALERLRDRSPRWPFPQRDLRARSVG